MDMKGDEQNMAVTSRFTNLQPPFWSFSAVFRMKHGGRDRPEWESKRPKPYSLELGGMGGGGGGGLLVQDGGKVSALSQAQAHE